MMQPPIATYRLQFHKDFTFNDLEQLIDYLHALGISTVYASPLFTAVPGSPHGYDVTDPQALNPEIGTLEQWRDITQRLREKGMTWLQDIVPNHMAFGMENPYLFDVLERGPQSPYYRYFDIHWEAGKLMAPFLGKPLREAVQEGEISVSLTGKGLMVHYFTQAWPLSVSAYALLTEGLLAYADVDALEAALISLKNTDTSTLATWQQARQAGFAAVAQDEKIQDALRQFNDNKPALQQLLDAQFYRLAHWQEAETEINFRRFFTVNSLIALRMEDEAVFNDYHRFVFQLYNTGIIQGLRIDHIDGLQDPEKYIARLRHLFGEDCYIIAEKILASHEVMPAGWALQGTSGYEFLAYVNWLLTNSKGAETLEQQYRALLPGTPAYKTIVYENKKRILVSYMGGEWENLTALAYALGLVPEGVHRETFKISLGEFMLCLPVYRLYPAHFPLPAADLDTVRQTVHYAKEKGIAGIFELNLIASWWQYNGSDAVKTASILCFLQRLLQFTGPLMAKGVEDTTFYQYNALPGHNEVGDAPDQLHFTVDHFHQLMRARQEHTPYSLNATATHDTKRGEDARLRLHVLGLFTGEWQQLVARWRAANLPFIQMVNGQPAPSLNDEYFIYQSLLCGFPPEGDNSGDFAHRMGQYFTKAVREGKVASNWNVPNEPYEAACQAFIRHLLDPEQPFLHTFQPFAQRVMQQAARASLSQVLIKITAPGIPDIYQGGELWDLSFVDPDNRRAVNYDIRREHLQRLQTLSARGFQAVWPYLEAHRAHGVEKMFVLWKALAARQRQARLFSEGDYLPLSTSRPSAVVAYARRLEGQWAVVVAGLLGGEGEDREQVFLHLPPEAPQYWENVFTGKPVDTKDSLPLAAILQDFPVALLTAVSV